MRTVEDINDSLDTPDIQLRKKAYFCIRALLEYNRSNLKEIKYPIPEITECKFSKLAVIHDNVSILTIIKVDVPINTTPIIWVTYNYFPDDDIISPEAYFTWCLEP